MMPTAAIVCFLAVLTMIAGCGADALSAEQRRTIRERELALMNGLLTADAGAAVGASDKVVEQCIFGELYSRADHRCIIAAESDSAMSRCMARIHEGQGPWTRAP